MRCPFCTHNDTQVKDSRPHEDGSVIKRRRQCPACGARFTTVETVRLRELFVIKKSGVRVPFHRDKLLQSVRIALRKRPFLQDDIEKIVNGLVRSLESAGEAEISSKRIGETVMEALLNLDHIAYIRYVSVYHDFTDPRDFEKLVVGLRENMKECA